MTYGDLIDIYNENNESTGEVATWESVHTQGLWHRVAHIWFWSKDKGILLQRRSKNKSSYPGLWDITAAGHLDLGEDVLSAAIRETEEEFGVVIKKDDLTDGYINKSEYIDNSKNWLDREWQYIYFYNFLGDITDIRLQESEVEAVEWMQISELRRQIMSDEGCAKFVPHKKESYFKIFDTVEKLMK